MYLSIVAAFEVTVGFSDIVAVEERGSKGREKDGVKDVCVVINGGIIFGKNKIGFGKQKCQRKTTVQLQYAMRI